MAIGALIVTTGLHRASGITALTEEAGRISAGQRMIAAFQCAGVSMVGLVVGPEEKKPERLFAQNGVVFLRCPDPNVSLFEGIRQGLQFMADKFDRVFLVPGDMPLFLPQTLKAMLESDASLVIPESKYMQGFPVLVDKAAMAMLLEAENDQDVDRRIREGAVSKAVIRVNDSGVLIRGSDMSHRKGLIQQHNIQLARPVIQVTLNKGGQLYDARLSMLLHLVEQTRSVRDACSLMQISYSAAWNMLNHVEEELGYPLVTRIRGGATGSGSILTKRGRALMEAYDGFTEELNQATKSLYDRTFHFL